MDFIVLVVNGPPCRIFAPINTYAHIYTQTEENE